ncbi:MAG TPA: DNA polymerase III subunit gamma/tau, partial [Hellea balneolensis]|nr:DNA polymerase III subunit gamma/tau [Hellea balneolensis]
GKTTTARLLARALNYQSDDHDGPSVQLDPPGEHCEQINASSHMDVMEMDAASRTGVGDIREILDSVRYAPVSARYKIYIIDEVHMLSTAAFNALLKTLEEPPEHAKFIFATTEIRKIPITVLSRCQRFDLRRVDAGVLSEHLEKICQKEGVKIAKEGLALIARAAEGSVRDGLSLLDQAIVQADGGVEVSAEQIRTMLGLADRTRVLDLVAHAMKGDAKAALAELRTQYNDGADPSVLVRDVLEICHDLSRAKALGERAEFDAAADQIARIHALAETLSMGQITALWQMLLSAYEDVRRAPDPLAGAEMAVLRMTVAATLPPPELASQLLENLKHVTSSPNTQNTSQSTTTSSDTPASQISKSSQPSTHSPSGSQASMQAQPALLPDEAPQMRAHVEINSLAELVAGMPKSETRLKYDIRQYVRPILFERGKIIFEAAPDAPANLAPRLLNYVQDMTAQKWTISLDTNTKGTPSLMEQHKQATQKQAQYENAHPVVVRAKELFAGVEIEFRDRLPTSNVIKADFSNNEDT